MLLGVGIGLGMAVAGIAIAFSIVAIPLFIVASTEPGSGLNRDLVRTGLFKIAVPFGVVTGIAAGVLVGLWYARGGRLPARPHPDRLLTVLGIVTRMVAAPLCILSVHAHPDDESSKGAGTVAKYHAEGIRTVLVCCTGGEEGDILNPAMDRDEVKADIGAVRKAELDRAAEIIGYDEVHMLGYRDSGMPDSEANKNPEAFANAPFDEAVGRLATILRATRPQVVLTYRTSSRATPTPTTCACHDITQPAIDKAADPDWITESGEPWQVSKVYYSVWSKKRVELTHQKYLELDLESPYSPEWFDRPWQDHRITTMIDIEGYAEVRFEALLAHATQIDPESPFWFGLPREVASAIHPYDDYIRAMCLVDAPTPEDDLFAGLRSEASVS